MILIEHFSGAVPVRVNISLPSTTIAVGSDLTIPCSVDGYPIPAVTWYKDGQILQNNERIQATGKRVYPPQTTIVLNYANRHNECTHIYRART